MVRMLCSRSASLMTQHADVARHRDDHLADGLGLRSASPYLTLSSLVTPSTRSATSSPKSARSASRV